MSTLTKQNLFEGFLESSFVGFEKAREEGKASFLNQGLPTLKSEEYKFTAITKKLEQSLSNLSPAKPFDLSEEEVSEAIPQGFEGPILVFSNGHLIKNLCLGIDHLNFSTLSEKLETPIGSIAKVDKDAFAALNQASFEEGVFISIPKKEVVEKPILLLSFNKANLGDVISPRVWIDAGDFAEVTFISHSINKGDTPYFVNKVVEIKGGLNSQIRYYRIQNEGKNAFEVSNIETNLLQDSRFTSVTLSLSGEMVRNNLSLNLLGSNSEGNMYGIYLLNGKTHVDNHTNVDHTIPHAESNELYKGILADQSRGVFNGKIFVRQDAQKTNAFQQNNNILLSNDATINTKPQLEIWADDVKCSHGCTTGQLDEEALFYLQARGIDKIQAKGLLLFAFAGEVLEHIENESFREYCTNLVQERLGSKF
ncbi:Fe-S cluster assembly protein SufD [Algoriphagus sp.]|uniref:Fe-S cluster assembly protein SufD n=1 Tax=Algoriphagus sp. TaxID=1872435 RepID=UPI0025DE41A2|nr:Fe-S cluster assembly protein SufD [Algoriphagus sp.]